MCPNLHTPKYHSSIKLRINYIKIVKLRKAKKDKKEFTKRNWIRKEVKDIRNSDEVKIMV